MDLRFCYQALCGGLGPAGECDSLLQVFSCDGLDAFPCGLTRVDTISAVDELLCIDTHTHAHTHTHTDTHTEIHYVQYASLLLFFFITAAYVACPYADQLIELCASLHTIVCACVCVCVFSE